MKRNQSLLPRRPIIPLRHNNIRILPICNRRRSLLLPRLLPAFNFPLAILAIPLLRISQLRRLRGRDALAELDAALFTGLFVGFWRSCCGGVCCVYCSCGGRGRGRGVFWEFGVLAFEVDYAPGEVAAGLLHFISINPIDIL